MHRFLALVILLSCAWQTSATVQIVEFCPDPHLYGDTDEYLVLSGTGSLDSVIISDGNEGFRFPKGTKINGILTIARSGTAYEQSHGIWPDFEWLDYSPIVPNVVNGNPLRMANAKDVLMLYENGNLVQKVSWPEDCQPREGQIHYLEKGVWDPRPLMIGQSRFSPAVFHNVSVTTFVSPDCSNDMFSYAVNQASGEVLLNVYEFSSPAMADTLIAARDRNVDVRIFLEGGPVGGITTEEKGVIRKMTDRGIPVSVMESHNNIPAPYRYNHGKYIVIDRKSLLITSENFKYSGFPPTGINGNRGWGVYLEDPGLAGYFSTVYITDSQGMFVNAYNGSGEDLEQIPPRNHTGEFLPAYFEGATVYPVIAPDTSNQITALINSAQSSIEIEQAYITNDSPSRLNPYLSAAINASRRGVHVRVLLDSYWFNIEDEKDNDEMVDIINQIGRSENIPLEARCAELALIDVDKIHNKGLIVDNQFVLVSSINWNSVSPNFNRETGVIIDHQGVAQYFLTVFEDDWKPSVKSQGTKTDYVKVIVVIVVFMSLMVLYYYRRQE
jgi:phosphatidylserine/phosphatidylglycerophosphate/cardiolipin synthase-like enzyme